MKKNIFGRKLKRDVNERRALFKGLISSLILKERIKTTEAKAKAIKGDVDKIITKVKKNGEFSKRILSDKVFPHALNKLINDIAPRFKNRQGGYTRIIRLGKRFGDDAEMVLMEWVEGPLPAVARLPRVEEAARKNKKHATTETRKRKPAIAEKKRSPQKHGKSQ